MINAVGRSLPKEIGSYKVKRYKGPYEEPAYHEAVITKRRPGHIIPGEKKLLPDLKAAILASGLKDGMTISFHHCFREGDRVIGQVLTAISELGIRHLRFAPSAVVNIKNPSIVDFVKNGTIDRIEASGRCSSGGPVRESGDPPDPRLETAGHRIRRTADRCGVYWSVCVRRLRKLYRAAGTECLRLSGLCFCGCASCGLCGCDY